MIFCDDYSKPLSLCGLLGGTNSRVHSALYQGLKCAVKFVDTADKWRDPLYKSTKRDLYTESSVLKEFSHPNIVQLYCPCVKTKLLDPYGLPMVVHSLVIEMLEGGELLSFAQKRPLTEDELRYYGLQVLDAIEYLHRRGFAHMDLKSDNILLDSTLTVAKIVDFGFATRTGHHAHGDSIKGTAEYIAPEVINMLPHDPMKADIFSLGVTFHTLATGTFPCISKCVQSDPVYRLLCEKKFGEFWKRTAQNVTAELGEDLRELLQCMLHPSMYYRPNVEQVKTHRWFSRPCPPKDKIVESMRSRQKAKV